MNKQPLDEATMRAHSAANERIRSLALKEPTVDELQIAAKSAWSQLKVDFRRTVQQAWQCGRTLTTLKAALPHGAWTPWLKANAIPVRSAQRLMEFATMEKRQLGAFESVDAGLQFLQVPAAQPSHQSDAPAAAHVFKVPVKAITTSAATERILHVPAHKITKPESASITTPAPPPRNGKKALPEAPPEAPPLPAELEPVVQHGNDIAKDQKAKREEFDAMVKQWPRKKLVDEYWNVVQETNEMAKELELKREAAGPDGCYKIDTLLTEQRGSESELVGLALHNIAMQKCIDQLATAPAPDSNG